MVQQLLKVSNLKSGYRGRSVLHDVNLHVAAGEIVTVIGHNGSGKSTLLNAVFGLIPCHGGQVVFMGEDVTHERPAFRVKRGLSLLPSGQKNCPNLSVFDNLLIGGYQIRDRGVLEQRIEEVWNMFPVLRDKRRQPAWSLSGGQQQMLGLAMATILKPRLLMLDEPTVGLAPKLIAEVMDRIQLICSQLGSAVLMVEQNVREAVAISHRVYALRVGEVVAEEAADVFLEQHDLWSLF